MAFRVSSGRLDFPGAFDLTDASSEQVAPLWCAKHDKGSMTLLKQQSLKHAHHRPINDTYDRQAKPVKGWAPGTYRVGDQRRWNGIVLVCTRGHSAGDAAEHPFDPGHGWGERKRSTLWRPLASVVEDLVARAEDAEVVAYGVAKRINELTDGNEWWSAPEDPKA